MPVRVLLIDDDARLRELVRSYLTDHDCVVVEAADGAAGLAALRAEPVDAVILDVMMPGMDGLTVCKRIRAESQVPIIMLTARGDETDRVVGLELGADDYLAKPFSPRELVARLRAVLRRAGGGTQGKEVRVAGLVIEPGARTVQVDGRDVTLTGVEFDVLLALAARAGRVVPRDSLMELAGRGDVSVGDRTVDVHISHLRQKLGDDSKRPALIKTVRGVGYVLARERTEGD